MYNSRPPQGQDIALLIVQAAEWWRAANIAARTKEEKLAIKQQLKSIRKYIGVEIKNSVDLIDDQIDSLKMERKKLLRLQTILNNDIEFAEDHIERMIVPTDNYDYYYGRKTNVRSSNANRIKRARR